MGQLTVTPCTALVPYGESPDDYLTEIELTRELAQLKKEYTNLTEFTQEVREYLNRHDIEMSAEVERLSAIMETISYQEQKNKAKEYQVDDDGETTEEEEDDSKAEGGSEFNEKQHKRSCKNIYSAISKRCHPDKTDNKHYHDLFTEASEAYARLDLDTLYEILTLVEQSSSKIKSVRNRAREKISDRLAKLRREITKVEKDISTIKDDPNYIIYEVYEIHGPHNARMFRQQLLRRNIDQMTAQIRIMGYEHYLHS